MDRRHFLTLSVAATLAPFALRAAEPLLYTPGAAEA